MSHSDKQVAVILAGCGVYDGAEIYESVLTLLHLDRAGAEYQCFAPDVDQMHVINHLTGEEMPETRNVLTEAARIVRGDIKPIDALDPNKFDALIVPGGFGAAKNLCDFAVRGADMAILPAVLSVLKGFANAHKPTGYVCIAPAMIPVVYGNGVTCTIGNDAEAAEAIQKMGGQHNECDVDDVVIDEQRKVVSTPAYMLANSISDADNGIGKLVHVVLGMVDK